MQAAVRTRPEAIVAESAPKREDEGGRLYQAWRSHRDRKALARLLELKLPFVFRVACRFLCNDHDAEDVTQQVLSRLCAAPSPDIQDLDRWLYVAVARAARDHVRGARNRQVREEQQMQRDNGAVQPADALERKETLHALHDALKTLPDTLREVVVLHYMESLPRKAVSEILDVPESTLRLRLDSALQKLQSLLNARGVTYQGATLVAALGALPAPQASAAFIAQVTSTALTAGAPGAGGVGAVATGKAASMGLLAKVTITAALAVAVGSGIALQQRRAVTPSPAPPTPPVTPAAAPSAPKQDERPGMLSFSYQMPRDAEVSVGLFDREGQLLRWLTRADFRRAGANTDYFDGRDQYGKLLPAGEYQLKALYHDRLTTEYALTLGNPGTPPWPTADGKGDWLSDEAAPQAAATDRKWVFLAAPGSEKGWSIIGVDESGQRQWGSQQDFYPRSVSLAVQGDYLYALFSGPELTKGGGRFDGKNAEGRVVLVCLDKRTGAAARFTKTTPHLKIATFPYEEKMIGLWELRTSKSFEPGVYGGQPRYFDIDFGDATHALGVAATEDTVYVSMYFDNRVLAFDAETGKPKPDQDIPLDKPVGLHALADGHLLAVSNGKVVRVDTKSKSATSIVSTGLAAPHTPTTDAKGNIYVSDWRDSFQVKVFSAEGKPLRAIGKPGGRPWLGKWEKDGLLVPRGVAVTGAGELWVAEDDSCPPRVSVWNAQNGAFIKDYIGPTPYGGGSMFWVDKDDPTVMHTLGTRFKVDWKRKTYLPLSSEIRRMGLDQPFVPNGHDLFGVGFRTFKHDGNDYVMVTGSRLVSVLMKKDDVYVPVAAMGGIHRWSTDDGTGRTQWDSDIGTHMIKNFYPPFFRGHSGDNFSWCDRNGDGRVQADEMTWVKTIFRGDAYEKGRQAEFLSGWGMGLSPDWSVFFYGFCKEKHIVDRVDLKGWTDGGAPIFDISSATEIAALDYGIEGLYVNDEKRLFAAGALGWAHREGKYPDPLPDALRAFDRDGKKLWGIAGVKEGGEKDVLASNVIGEFNVPGIGSVLCTWQWWGNWRPYLVSSDGLYVGTVLDDGKVGPAGLWDESLNYFYQAPDGTPYVINGANDTHHFLKIKGLEKCGRFEARYTISEADAKRIASTPPPETDNAKKDIRPILSLRWLDTPPTIDGALTDWDMDYGAKLDGGEGKSATVALGRDEANLYLAYRVQDDTPLLNKGQNWQTLFISGDCVDLMLGTDPKAEPNRYSAVPGDLRLLLGVFQDAPIAVLYRPVVPDSREKPVQLMAARMDRIERLTDAKVAFKRGEGAYEIEASVPLKTLGLDPHSTAALRGDVGVIYSDATGRDRTKRLYFYNHKTKIVADLTTEATLQPSEWRTLLFPLGRNLLRDGGFEGDFAKRPEDGWTLTRCVNGMSAQQLAESPHSGQHALVIKQAEPVTFPEEAFTYEDYGQFVKSANGGKGGGGASIEQRVPVTGGKTYSLRFFFRSEGMKLEEKKPGKDRGYSTFSPWINWIGGEGGNVWVGNEQRDTDGWAERLDARFNYWGVPKHYTAPKGATAAIIVFHATVNAPNILPTMVLDDVEFVEIKE